MEAIEELLDWGKDQGIELDGIAATPLPGRGIGLVATRDLKEGQDILVVPTSCLRSIANTPKSITTALQGTPIHGILSASLTLETAPDFEHWHNVFPSKSDIESCMPAYWPKELQSLLPDGAKNCLEKQLAKIKRDWEGVSKAYPDMKEDEYLYHWHLVNSRSFYHVTPQTEKLPRDERMILQPVADLLNHHPTRGCAVAFDKDDYTITTQCEYKKGEEVFIGYGSHSNDILLVEYGFIIPNAENPWDETPLDAYLCPRFSPKQRKKLEDEGFWGEYKLDGSSPVCYRTQVALRSMLLNDRQFDQVILGRRDEDLDKEAANKELLEVLRVMEKDVRGKLKELEYCKAGEEEMRETVRKRWLQIKEMVDSAMSQISADDR